MPLNDAPHVGLWLTKLPSLDPSWPLEVQDGWMRCFNSLKSIAAPLGDERAPTAQAKADPGPVWLRAFRAAWEGDKERAERYFAHMCDRIDAEGANSKFYRMALDEMTGRREPTFVYAQQVASDAAPSPPERAEPVALLREIQAIAWRKIPDGTSTLNGCIRKLQDIETIVNKALAAQRSGEERLSTGADAGG